MSVSEDKINVLHVDDEPDFADTAAEILEREDDRIFVQTATNAQEGLEKLADSDIDCIVSDYKMPGQNGIEFLKIIKEKRPDLPLILYTGKGSEAVASDAISVGLTDYLQKEPGTDHYKTLANEIVSAVHSYRTEQELEQLRRQYTHFVEQSIVGIYIIQRDQFVYVNPHLAEIHGYDSPEEIIGMSPLGLVAPSERQRVQTHLEQQISGEKQEIHYQTKGLRQDGEQIEIELHGSRIEYEGEPAVIGVELDITERKEHEQELEQAKRRLDMALQEARAGIFEWDIENEELYWSDELLDLLGVSVDEFDGEYDMFEKRLHPDDVGRVEAAMETAIETGSDYQVEHRMKRADGEYLWLDVRGQVVEDQGSQLVIGIGIDITDRKEREARLQRQRDRLDEFASVVSHDLRNPLNVAQGRIELAKEQYDSEHIDTAARAVDRSLDLIDEMLELARAGQEVSDMEPVDVANLVHTCWKNVQTSDATIVADIDSTIQADRSRLSQLLENLFRNAIDHGGEDVDVNVGELNDGFYVADDGPGIPESDREDVFEAGYSTSEGGMGFGLRIVTEIVEAHDWEIRVTESTDGGARFEITGVEFTAE